MRVQVSPFLICLGASGLALIVDMGQDKVPAHLSQMSTPRPGPLNLDAQHRPWGVPMLGHS